MLTRITDYFVQNIPALNNSVIYLRTQYGRLSAREQLLAKIAGGLLILWLAYDLIYISYMDMRAQVLLAHQQTYEDYEWLESQQERLVVLLSQRGVQRGGLNDLEKLLDEYIEGETISYEPDNLVEISWQGDSAQNFLKAVNSLVNKGATLISLEFNRQGNSPRTTFNVRLRI